LIFGGGRDARRAMMADVPAHSSDGNALFTMNASFTMTRNPCVPFAQTF
jgi:hypothetical protein